MTKSISKTCKLFKNCKNRGCIKELKAVYGKNWKSPKAKIIWSVELCYALEYLKKNGLVQEIK